VAHSYNEMLPYRRTERGLITTSCLMKVAKTMIAAAQKMDTQAYIGLKSQAVCVDSAVAGP